MSDNMSSRGFSRETSVPYFV